MYIYVCVYCLSPRGHCKTWGVHYIHCVCPSVRLFIRVSSKAHDSWTTYYVLVKFYVCMITDMRNSLCLVDEVDQFLHTYLFLHRGHCKTWGVHYIHCMCPSVRLFIGVSSKAHDSWTTYYVLVKFYVCMITDMRNSLCLMDEVNQFLHTYLFLHSPHARIQKILSEGVHLWQVFFWWWVGDPNITTSGPSSARQRNAIWMAFRWRADDSSTLNAGSVAL